MVHHCRNVLAVDYHRSGSRSSAYTEDCRGNSQDPTERVFDYADMLTDEEEQNLREYIAECEEKIQADIVIVTISESVEYDLQNPGSCGGISCEGSRQYRLEHSHERSGG